MTSRDPALDQAGRLGDFLDKSIEELRPTADKLPTPTIARPALPGAEAMKPAAPNKFAELADLIARSKKAHHARADKLTQRVIAANEKINSKFDEHEQNWSRHEDGVGSLDEIFDGLNSNAAPPDDE